MKMARFTEAQIIKILKEYDAGRDVKDICRDHGISRATFYNWKKRYGGMEASQLKRLKELEDENKRLKRMYADLSLDHELLKDVLEKSSKAFGAQGCSRLFNYIKSDQYSEGLQDCRAYPFNVVLPQ